MLTSSYGSIQRYTLTSWTHSSPQNFQILLKTLSFTTLSRHRWSMDHVACSTLVLPACMIENAPSVICATCSRRHRLDMNDGYPLYQRRKPADGRFIARLKMGRQEVEITNRWRVPHCPLLSKPFNAHINVEFREGHPIYLQLHLQGLIWGKPKLASSLPPSSITLSSINMRALLNMSSVKANSTPGT